MRGLFQFVVFCALTFCITSNALANNEDNRFSFRHTGRIHIDNGAFIDDEKNHPNETKLRRARIGLNGKLPQDLSFRVAVDFGNKELVFKDAFLSYNGIKNTQFRVGDFKPGFMLEEMISSNDMTFIERAPILNAFTNARRLGAAFDTHGENWTTEVGLFGPEAGGQSNDEEWSIAGRSTYAAILEDRNILHFGGSWSYREPGRDHDTFNFDAKANNSIQDSDSVSATITNAKSAGIYTIEAARTIGSLGFQGEYLVADINRNTNENVMLHGGYAQMSWFVTGENRNYSTKNGAYENPTVTNPLNPSTNDWGSLELAARFSYADLNDDDIAGGEITTTDIGVNWYLNKNIRLMGNVIFANTDDKAVTANDDPTIFLFRTQAHF